MDEPDANAFVPSRPSKVTPDPTDGVPQSIEPLQWEAPTSAVTTAVTAAVIAATRAKRPPDEPAEINAPTPPPNPAAPLSKPVPKPKRPTASRANLAADARRALEEARWDEATDLYRKAIASARGKRLDGIISDLEAVAKVQPSSKRVHELLGEAYARKGDWSASREAFNRALELIDEA
jgi:tetratricopeptide (TPR) repeat protein